MDFSFPAGAALNPQRLIRVVNLATYTSLFWLGDTSSVDEYLRERKKEEASAKKNRV